MMMRTLKLVPVTGNRRENAALWSPATAIPVMLIAIPAVLCAILIANALIGVDRLTY